MPQSRTNNHCRWEQLRATQSKGLLEQDAVERSDAMTKTHSTASTLCMQGLGRQCHPARRLGSSVSLANPQSKNRPPNLHPRIEGAEQTPVDHHHRVSKSPALPVRWPAAERQRRAAPKWGNVPPSAPGISAEELGSDAWPEPSGVQALSKGARRGKPRPARDPKIMRSGRRWGDGVNPSTGGVYAVMEVPLPRRPAQRKTSSPKC